MHFAREEQKTQFVDYHQEEPETPNAKASGLPHSRERETERNDKK